ncbi:GntR family transcriptional regulator [Amycolatopsis magusensis]|uniref:GntR family transcriptional regulator n=1 Tax=Amycolatopsis magusensis TaxID=882444 RepID=UPI0024A7B073|nr:GntR family transcriptional regulator [Amycolatopsis magusensis]MDI5976753.1 GntR family transcriptional regulator [Amycolatopsis magusensis]
MAGNGDHRPSQTDGALAMLRSRIIDLTLRPGSRIDEPLLISQFQLGRTPAREAINRLAAEGFVTIQPNRGGTFVRALDLAEIGDIVVAQQLVENVLGQQCRLDDPALADDLAEIQRDYAEQVRTRNHLLITEVNERFHLRLHRTVGNSFFYAFAESTHRHARRLNVYLYQLEAQLAAQQDREFEINLEEHERIITAVAERDHDTLRALLPEHARGTQRRLVRLLSEHAVEKFGVDVFLDPLLEDALKGTTPRA